MSELIESGAEFVRNWEENAAYLAERGLYDPEQEHSSCGVGCIVAIDGTPRREVVVKGIEALKAVWHRGAVDADGKTGDGAGIHIEIPQGFFREQIKGARAGDERIAVGMVFLPRNSFQQQEACRTLVESEVLGFGYSIRGWRQVPVDTSVLGEKAAATRPEIEQIIIGNPKGTGDVEFERELYIIRRRIEKQALADNITDFYICSLSSRSIIYKGLFLAESLAIFYPDLKDERFVSSFAVFHQRYSTNTMPAWKLAQPFRVIAHNGEINTLRGNVNWMKSHETRMVADAFGAHNDDIKPLIQTGSSDSAALDAVFETLAQAGRRLPLAKLMLVPPAWSHRMVMPQEHKDLFSYCNCVMEPWDGPAALVGTDSRWVICGMDRNGLRPMRYSRTRDGLLVVGSETGMVPLVEADIVEKGRVGPGEMIGVDLETGTFYRDRALKDFLSGQKPYSRWMENITHLDQLVAKLPFAPASLDRLDGRRHAPGRALEEVSRPASLLSPAVQPGDQPADRPAARVAGDEPQDALRQSRQRL
jgi:glutamate synthase (NADPH/NADH) large chain